MQYKIFSGYAPTLEGEINKWIASDKPEIVETTQSSDAGIVTITIRYQAAEPK